MSFNKLDEIRKYRRSSDRWEYFSHIFGDRLVALIQDSKITPNHLTILSLFMAVAASFFIAFGSYAGLVTGAVLLQISFILDCTDGTLARYKKIFSPFGPWLDSITDRIKEFFIILSLTYKFSDSNKYAIFFGLYTLFLIFMYHGEEVKKLSASEKNGKPENIISKINAFRKRIKLGLFSSGEQCFILVFFLILNRIDLLFYVFTIYGTIALIAVHIYKISRLR